MPLPLFFGLAAIGIAGPTVLAAVLADRLTRTQRRTGGRTPLDLGVAAKPVEFPARQDRLLLRGWYLPPQPTESGVDPATAPHVVLVHGGADRRADSTGVIDRMAVAYARAGIGALLFDLRGWGESDGYRFSLGYYERRDVLGAVDELRRRDLHGPIVLHGWSMGAATAILAGADEPGVAGVIADSSFASARELLARLLPEKTRLPAAFLPLLLAAVRRRYGIDVAELEPARAVARLGGRPLLVIHGQGDRTVPVEDAHRIALDDARLVVVPGADHCGAYAADPTRYVELALDFVRRLRRT